MGTKYEMMLRKHKCNWFKLGLKALIAIKDNDRGNRLNYEEIAEIADKAIAAAENVEVPE